MYNNCTYSIRFNQLLMNASIITSIFYFDFMRYRDFSFREKPDDMCIGTHIVEKLDKFILFSRFFVSNLLEENENSV